MPPRKALLVLENKNLRKPVSQAELNELSLAQTAAWEAHEYAVKLSDGIRRRIEAGATVQQGTFFFDPKKRMARETRRREA